MPVDSCAVEPGDQAREVAFRRQVASATQPAFGVPEEMLSRVAEHHSIPVMDREAARFLSVVPTNGVVLDIGGGFGWPWRYLDRNRPDISVVVVDLVRENLLAARALLGGLVGRQIFLAHGNACRLAFDERIFDGIWTVQTFQHVSAVEAAYAEAARVLKPGSRFANYALNDTAFLRFLYRAAGRRWHREGALATYFLRRMSASEKTAAERIFGTRADERFTEILFCPELRVTAGGSPNSILGQLDSCLGGNSWQRWFARQHSLHLTMPAA